VPRSDSNQSQEILWDVGDGQDTLWDVGNEGEAQGSRIKFKIKSRFMIQVQGQISLDKIGFESDDVG